MLSLRRVAYLAIGRTLTNGWVHRVHRWLYVRAGARGPIGRALGVDMGVLTTTGRQTGRAQEAPLVVAPVREAWVVVGSNGGRDRTPAWVANLRADARASLRLGVVTIPVVAREPEGEERERLWRHAAGAYPGFEVYRHRTARPIPVFLLERAATEGD
jgi:deazaflavin-dependent oxidoreductase (nitroreductase family)